MDIMQTEFHELNVQKKLDLTAWIDSLSFSSNREFVEIPRRIQETLPENVEFKGTHMINTGMIEHNLSTVLLYYWKWIKLIKQCHSSGDMWSTWPSRAPVS